MRYRAKRLLPNNDEELSLDEKCALKRLELKTLLDDISNYAVEKDVKNSFDNLSALNRTLHIFGQTLDIGKEARGKHPEYVYGLLLHNFSSLRRYEYFVWKCR